MAANFSIDVTTEPTAVPGITAGTTYVVNNESRASEVLIEVASAVPGKDSRSAVRLTPWGGNSDAARAKVASGESLYVWRGTGAGAAYVSIGEEP